MRKAILLTLMMAIKWALTITAQPQCTVTHYDEFSGMAQWYVTQIVQDKQGMMWFATWNGLNRYDGYEFVNFKSRVGDGIDMPSDRISDLILAENDSMYCSVENKIFGFSTKTCKFFKIPISKENQLRKEFNRRYQEGLIFEQENKLNYYRDIYGTMWTISQQGRLMYEHPSSGQSIDYPANWNNSNRIRFCTSDKEGNAWFTSSYGVFKLSFNRKPYKFFEQEKPGQVRCFFKDHKNRYWISTRDGATIRVYDSQNQLLGYLGRDGQLHSQYTSFGSPIYHLMQDSKGYFWLCSKPDGLYRLHETREGEFALAHFVHDDQDINSLNYNELYYAVEDQQGRIWVATFGNGINCIPDPHVSKPVFIHLNNGLRYPKDSGLRVRQLHITRQHILMGATTTGLIVADIAGKDVRHLNFKLHTKDIHRSNSLSNNATMYVAEDSKQRVYVCTESGGLNQIMSEDLLTEHLEFRHFNLSTGFPSDVVLSAVPYNDSLIVVSNNQIVLLRPDETKSLNYDTFLGHDRLRFSDAAPMQLPDGRSIFGLQNGAITLNSTEMLKSDFVPPLVLTKLSIENGLFDYAINKQDTLILTPLQRNIFLQFSALDYAADGTIDYAFRLGTSDQAWNRIGRDHSIPLLDLKPGSYQLQIRSTNHDGVWVDNIRTLTIIVKPTFWETGWTQLLYTLILLLVVSGIIFTRRYIINLKRHQKELHEAYLALLNAKKPSQALAMTEDIPAKTKIKPEDKAFMQHAMKFIEEHLGDADINIGDMAAATATSRSGLNRKMKSLLGVTPLEFIREARIRKACQMLKEGASINDVAYSCGFSDPKYFAKCFKADMEMTPTEYKVENSAN